MTKLIVKMVLTLSIAITFYTYCVYASKINLLDRCVAYIGMII